MPSRMLRLAAGPLLTALLLLAASCSPRAGGSESSNNAAAAAAAAEPEFQGALDSNLRSIVDRKFTGDLDAMIQRRVIRVAVPFNRTFYFVDKGVQRGLSYEYVKLFEDELNRSKGTGNLKIHLVLLPMQRDMMLRALEAGQVDMVVAQLTITPERQRRVDFTHPTRGEVSEIPVTGPGTQPPASAEALSGKHVFVRRSSSYFGSLEALNRRLAAGGRPPVIIEQAPENLEDDDLLEMVNAGLIPATVVDDFMARFWKQVFPTLVLGDRAPLTTGGRLGVAIRKQSPQLAASLNDFIARNGLDTALGKILSRRYLQSTKFVTDAGSQGDRAKFLAMVDLFRKYGEAYDFDYLLMAAQAYQESRLDQNVRSPVGAIGVMQLMPETGREQGVGDVHQLEPNINAGVKYMHYMLDRYYKDAPMDRLNKELFTFASYNAGPARIRQLRAEAAQRGLNPNVWFGNVEQIASEKIGRETVTYVSNIFKYYIAYRLISEQRAQREASRAKIAKRTS